MSHREGRRHFHVHFGALQRLQQRDGSFVAARNVEHARPAHRHGLRNQYLLGAGAGDVHFHQVHAALGNPRFEIHNIAAGLQIRFRGSDFLALRC